MRFLHNKRIIFFAIFILPISAWSATLASTNVRFNGYIKVDSMWSRYSDGTLPAASFGRDFYIPGLTPVGGEEENWQFDTHIKQSRFRFTTDTELENDEKITGVFEFDFQVTPAGNERVSNSFTPRIRLAFIKYKGFLVGQTWSTFQDVKVLPETLDFVGLADATIFDRQTMVRYTNGAFEIALENPETTITPYGGGARIVSDDNELPDLAARYTVKGAWGHVSVAGLLRQLSYVDKQNGANIDDTEISYGISVTSKVKFGRDDLRLIANIGSGLGRYIGLNVSNGAVIDAENNLEAIDSYGIGVAYRHWWNDKWRSSLTYSLYSADNDTELTGPSVTKETWSSRLNLLFSPNRALTLGGEIAIAERTLESDADGDMTRLQFSAKYTF